MPHQHRSLFVGLLLSGLSLVIAGCGGPKSGKGFKLPDGDVDRGQTAFVSLKCYSCHTVSGVELPAPDSTETKIVPLGGTTPRIQTYGQLVTSIINPSHKIAEGFERKAADESGKAESPMVNNNDIMTVSQLIDLVRFLQSHYELEPVDPSNYYVY